jgi:hypothetical protein
MHDGSGDRPQRRGSRHQRIKGGWSVFNACVDWQGGDSRLDADILDVPGAAILIRITRDRRGRAAMTLRPSGVGRIFVMTIPQTMRAAVARGFGQPLSIEEWPVPRPGYGEVLVRIAASGVCHTDPHAAEGDWPVKPALPFIPGHEGVGWVAALQMVRRKGTVSLVGLPPGTFDTPIFDVVSKRITVRGSIIGTRQDLAEAIAFAAAGKVRATRKRQRFRISTRYSPA